MDGNNDLVEFDEIIKRLNVDLDELESTSNHLDNVKDYVKTVKDIDDRIAGSITTISDKIEKLMDKLTELSEKVNNDLRNLTTEFGTQLEIIKEINIKECFDSIDKNLSSMRETIDSNSDNNRQLTATIQNYESQLLDIRNNVNKIQNDLTGFVLDQKENNEKIILQFTKISELIDGTMKKNEDEFAKSTLRINKTISENSERIKHGMYLNRILLFTVIFIAFMILYFK